MVHWGEITNPTYRGEIYNSLFNSLETGIHLAVVVFLHNTKFGNFVPNRTEQTI